MSQSGSEGGRLPSSTAVIQVFATRPSGLLSSAVSRPRTARHESRMTAPSTLDRQNTLHSCIWRGGYDLRPIRTKARWPGHQQAVKTGSPPRRSHPGRSTQNSRHRARRNARLARNVDDRHPSRRWSRLHRSLRGSLARRMPLCRDPRLQKCLRLSIHGVQTPMLLRFQRIR